MYVLIMYVLIMYVLIMYVLQTSIMAFIVSQKSLQENHELFMSKRFTVTLASIPGRIFNMPGFEATVTTDSFCVSGTIASNPGRLKYGLVYFRHSQKVLGLV